jgi:cellulose synthase/poly-beta-1,6-N-acetylglucosamine synthase-like glycosyltransferase
MYNVENYIGYCLKSICEQDFDKTLFEIIVVDDCSSDASCDVTERIIDKYPDTKISLIHHDANKRQGGARNTGLRVAKGEYIIWVDSDDCFIYKDTLSTLYNVLASNKIDVLRSKSYTQVNANYFYSLKKSEFSSDIKNTLRTSI